MKTLNPIETGSARPMKTSLISALLVVMVAACSDTTSVTSVEVPGAPQGVVDAATMKAEMISALSIRDTLDRNTQLVGLVHKLDASNLEGAIEAHEASFSKLDQEEIRVFANGWARLDAKGALDRVTTWRNPGVMRRAISEIVYYWTYNGGAKEAREYALKSVAASEDDTETSRNVILDSVVRGLAAANEYEQLNALLEPFPADRTRNWVATQGMLELYRQGLPNVQAWVDSIPWDAKNNLKRDVLRSALVSMVGADADMASAWFERVEGNLEKGEFLSEFAVAWAQDDPLAAIQWLRERSQSANRSTALRQAAFVFLKVKKGEAVTWIEANLEDPLIDTTMRFPLAQFLMSVDFHEALPVAEKISKQSEKVNALKQILMIWSREDYDAVKRYMSNVGVPPEVEKTVIGQNAIRQQKRSEAAESQR